MEAEANMNIRFRINKKVISINLTEEVFLKMGKKKIQLFLSKTYRGMFYNLFCR